MSEIPLQDSNSDFKLTPFTPVMQKAALETYNQAKEAVQELKDKFGPSHHELSPLEPLIEKLVQTAQTNEPLKQKMLQIHESFDFLKEEHLRFEKTQHDLLGNLTLHLQNLDHLKEDILKSALADAEPKVKILESHLQELKQKIADYELSLSKAKENFNNNRRELTTSLEQCSKEFEALKETPICLKLTESHTYIIKPDSTHGQAAAQIFLQFVAKLMKEGKIPQDAQGPHYSLDEKRDLNLFMKDFKDHLKDFSPQDYF